MPDDRMFRAILMVLVMSAVLGTAIMLAGDYLLHSPEVARFGTGVAVVSFAVYVFFRVLGAREMKRRKDRAAADEDGGPDPA